MPHFFTQKHLVEKVVENVEKSILSTKKRKIRENRQKKKSHFFRKKAVMEVAELRVTETETVKKFQCFFAEKVGIFENGDL